MKVWLRKQFFEVRRHRRSLATPTLKRRRRHFRGKIPSQPLAEMKICDLVNVWKKCFSSNSLSSRYTPILKDDVQIRLRELNHVFQCTKLLTMLIQGVCMSLIFCCFTLTYKCMIDLRHFHKIMLGYRSFTVLTRKPELARPDEYCCQVERSVISSKGLNLNAALLCSTFLKFWISFFQLRFRLGWVIRMLLNRPLMSI